MKQLISIFMFFNLFIAIGQNNANFFSFARLPQAAMINPSHDIEAYNHFTIPFIGNNRINIGISGMTAYDLFADNSIPFQDKVQNAVYNMTPKDFVLVNQKMEIINIGHRLQSDYYISFGFYEELDLYSTIPVEVVKLFYEGTTFPGKEYNIDDLVAQSSLLGVYHVGIQKTINSELSIGGRFKIYNAAFDAIASSNKGSFRTNLSDDNIYTHSLSDIDVGVKTSGIVLDDYSVINGGYLAKKMFFTGNKGIGVDLGVTYQLRENINVAASINDLGVIFNNKEVKTYAYKGDYTTGSIAFEYDSNKPSTYFNRLKYEFEENVPLDENKNNYTSWRPVQLNSSIKYSFGKKRNNVCNYFKNVSYYHASSIGGLLQGQKRPGQILYTASLFYERNFQDIIHARINYSVDKFSSKNIGLAISAQVWKLNLFAGVNNILGLGNLAKTNSVFAQFGINVIIE